jgi:hypothetical protein
LDDLSICHDGRVGSESARERLLWAAEAAAADDDESDDAD